jgi:hypothetical protein
MLYFITLIPCAFISLFTNTFMPINLLESSYQEDRSRRLQMLRDTDETEVLLYHPEYSYC